MKHPLEENFQANEFYAVTQVYSTNVRNDWYLGAEYISSKPIRIIPRFEREFEEIITNPFKYLKSDYFSYMAKDIIKNDIWEIRLTFPVLFKQSITNDFRRSCIQNKILTATKVPSNEIL